MTFPDLFRPRSVAPPRTSCPFCPGPLSTSATARLCNVCRRHVQGAR